MKLLILFSFYFSVLLLYSYAEEEKIIVGDGDLTTPEIIRKYGYPVEIHHVTTTDGYILEMHRIPNRSAAPVAFLLHGILCTSSTFVLIGPKDSLAFQAADAGYDVWLGNNRGNTYSRNHQTLDPNFDHAFWNFSWHEMGIYDLPAMIDYTLDVSREKKLYFIGHSEGTTVSFVMASMLPEYNDKLEMMIELAPAVFMNHIPSPVTKLFSLIETENLGNIFVNHELLASGTLLDKIARKICAIKMIAQVICENILFLFVGFDPQLLNISILDVFLGHVPAGCSTNQILHYAQIILSGQFRQFDYNLVANKNVENNNYNLSQITAPVALFYGLNDWFISVEDVKHLSTRLVNLVRLYEVPWPRFNHLDFFLALNATQLVYNEVFAIMKPI